ncbi:MAG: hypothetical protein ACT4OY_02710 [Alphaproteobacteria bacterium]
MRDPQMGSFNLWDTVYGEQTGTERFRSAVPLMSGYTLAAGEKTVGGNGALQLLLAEIDHRGRIVWEKTHDIPDLKSVVKLLNRPDGVLVLGGTSSGSTSNIWLGLFDLKGELLSEVTVTHKHALRPQDIIAMKDVPGYLLSASAETSNAGFYTQLYGLDTGGAIIFERAYRPGLDNQIFSLAPLSNGQYIGAGLVKNGEGQEQGWIAVMDVKGNIAWQRAYPYGASAKLAGIAAYDGGRVAVMGDTLEPGSRYRSGWAMMVSATDGQILWQRRARSGSAWFARGLIITGDKISALYNTALRRDERQEYARLLTFDSRGQLLAERGYFNGAGAHGAQLVEGKSGARIVVGSSDAVYTRKRTAAERKSGLKDDEITRGIDAWMVAGEEAPVAADRCASIGSPQ